MPLKTLHVEQKLEVIDQNKKDFLTTITSIYKKEIDLVIAACKMKDGIFFFRNENKLDFYHPLKEKLTQDLTIPGRYILFYGIANYLSTFPSKPKRLQLEELSNMDKANHLIENCTGSCANRAFIAAAIAHSLDIDAQSSENEIHQMIEISYTPNCWIHIELGGYDTDIEIQRKPEISLTPSVPPTLPLSLLRENISSTPIIKIKFFNWWEAQIKKPCKSPMAIYFNNEADLESFYACMLRYLNTTNETCHYLPKLKNISSYRYRKDEDQYKQVQGNATKAYLQECKDGVFLVNFSDPLPGCTSLIDEMGSYQGIVISANIRRIVLILKSHCSQISQELYSRFHPIIENIEEIIDMSEDPYNGSILDKPLTDADDTLEVLCGNSARDVFLGRPYFDNDKMTIRPSPLLKYLEAIESGIREKKSRSENKVIALYGFTNDHEHRIKLIELINNKRNPITNEPISLNSNIKFYITPSVLFKSNYKIHHYLNIDEIDWHLPLSRKNFQSYFTHYKIDDHGIMIDSSGWLKIFENRSLAVVVIDQLSAKEWAQLLEAAPEHKTVLQIINLNQTPLSIFMQMQPKEIRSTVAPTLTTISSFSTKLALPSFSIVLTNDLEKTLQGMFPLNDKRPPVYCLSSQHTSNDVGLIIKPTESNKINFVFGDLVKTLSSGKNAIIAINGLLSKDLETWLATLLQPEPFLIINGEKYKISGKLMLVTTEMTSFSYSSNRFKISDALLASIPSVLSPPSTFFQVINGSIGSGKSSYIKACIGKNKVHVDLTSWIEDKTENAALVIEHGHKKGKNLLAPFYGLCLLPSSPTILFEGRLLSIPQGKAIFVEYNADALEDKTHYHYFQRKLCLKEIPLPTEEQLITKIIIPILKDNATIEYKTHGEAICKRILLHYQTFKMKIQLSTRNVANIAYRLKYLFSKIFPTDELEKYIDVAAYEEISGLLSEADRHSFMHTYLASHYVEINSRLCDALEWKSTSHFIVNYSALTLARQVEIFLKKCDDRFGPFGLLIQGDSGIGKTEGVKAFLTTRNVDFIHIQVVDKQLIQLELNRALAVSKIIIIDELDALPVMGIIREFLDKGGKMIGIFNGGCSYPNRQMLDDDLINVCIFTLAEYPKPQELRHVLIKKYVEPTIEYLTNHRLTATAIIAMNENLIATIESLVKEHIEIRLRTKNDALKSNPRVLYRQAEEAIEAIKQEAIRQNESNKTRGLIPLFSLMAPITRLGDLSGEAALTRDFSTITRKRSSAMI